MVKTYVFLFFLLSYNLTNCAKIEVEYDDLNDVILLNGKMYLPLMTELKNSLNHRLLSETVVAPVNPTEVKPSSAHHEEKELSSGTFWFYILIIFCKIFFY
jgi:hypothetical protein